jgi:hypothetical protein
MRFARLQQDLSFRDLIEMEVTAYNDLLISKPDRAALLRPLVIDPSPTITTAEKVVEGPIVVELTQARQTWTVVDKTAEDLEAEDLLAELAQVTARIDNLNAAIDEHAAILAVPYSEPVAAATNGAEITALRTRMKDTEQALRKVERDLVLNMRVSRWLMREARRRLSTTE